MPDELVLASWLNDSYTALATKASEVGISYTPSSASQGTLATANEMNTFITKLQGLQSNKYLAHSDYWSYATTTSQGTLISKNPVETLVDDLLLMCKNISTSQQQQCSYNSSDRSANSNCTFRGACSFFSSNAFFGNTLTFGNTLSFNQFSSNTSFSQNSSNATNSLFSTNNTNTPSFNQYSTNVASNNFFTFSQNSGNAPVFSFGRSGFAFNATNNTGNTSVCTLFTSNCPANFGHCWFQEGTSNGFNSSNSSCSFNSANASFSGNSASFSGNVLSFQQFSSDRSGFYQFSSDRVCSGNTLSFSVEYTFYSFYVKSDGSLTSYSNTTP